MGGGGGGDGEASLESQGGGFILAEDGSGGEGDACKGNVTGSTLQSVMQRLQFPLKPFSRGACSASASKSCTSPSGSRLSAVKLRAPSCFASVLSYHGELRDAVPVCRHRLMCRLLSVARDRCCPSAETRYVARRSSLPLTMRDSVAKCVVTLAGSGGVVLVRGVMCVVWCAKMASGRPWGGPCLARLRARTTWFQGIETWKWLRTLYVPWGLGGWVLLQGSCLESLGKW